jgi:hypothetical protein
VSTVPPVLAAPVLDSLKASVCGFCKAAAWVRTPRFAIVIAFIAAVEPKAADG